MGNASRIGLVVATLLGVVAIGLISSRRHLPNRQVASSPVVSVPIRLLGTEAPVVLVNVQGRQLPLQLDLGAALELIIHPDVLETLHSEPTGEIFKGVSMDGEISTPIVRLDLVELGGLKVPGVLARADVHDEDFLNRKKSAIGAVGFVGRDLFKSGQLVVDYSRQELQISLADGAETVRNICHGPSVPLVPDSDWGLTTPVDTDVGVLQFVWDTGSPAILMSRAAAASVQLATDVESTTFDTFVVGGKDFGPQRIEIWDMPFPPGMAGLIGHPMFHAHAICIDGARQRLHIQ